MSNVNRHTDWKEITPILIGVNSGVTVEMGDLMFLDSTNNLRNNGSSTATNYAYPFEYFRLSGSSLTLNKAGIKRYFLGIAMDDVDGENNNFIKKITVATKGVFNMDLKPPKTIYALEEYFGASGTTSESDLFNQKVMKVSGSSFALGYFAENKIHALKAKVVIRTVLNGVVN